MDNETVYRRKSRLINAAGIVLGTTSSAISDSLNLNGTKFMWVFIGCSCAIGFVILYFYIKNQKEYNKPVFTIGYIIPLVIVFSLLGYIIFNKPY